MYSQFSTDLILKLSESGFSADVIGAVLNHLDMVATNYSISRTTTSLVVRGREEMFKYGKLFVICKQIEGCKEGTIKNYGTVLKHFIEYVNCPLDEIDSNVIRKYLLLYKMDHDIMDRSLDKIRETLGNWFLWLQNEGYITKNPCANVSKIKYPKTQKEALDLNELEHLRDCCRTDRERALIEVLFSTGCRITEALSINVKDIKWNLPKPEVKVIGKGDKEGIVYFSARSISVMKKYLASRNHDSEWLFCNDRGGGQMKRENAEKIFRQLRELAGLEDKKLSPHTMRHTTATVAAKVAPIQVVKEILRHEKIDTTMVYAETSIDDIKTYHSRAIM